MKKKIEVPDIGAYTNVPVIEVLVNVGDVIKKDTSLITLETEKATMEVPAPFGGTISEMLVQVGSKVSKGDPILTVEVEDTSKEEAPKEEAPKAETKQVAPKQEAPAEKKEEAKKETSVEKKEETSEKPETEKSKTENAVAPKTAAEKPETQKEETSFVHAGPSARRIAREYGVDLTKVSGSGQKGRIQKRDIQNYVKTILQTVQSGRDASASTTNGGGASLGLALPAWPSLDFSDFGPTKREPLSRIKKLSGGFLHRNWIMVPHITQFDEADITELEAFRKDHQSLAEKEGFKLTPLVFIMKAAVAALKQFPFVNASLDNQKGELILKQFFHIGVAVDTPNGLVVPVIRDVDKKGLFQLAKELAIISDKARKGQLSAKEMQGSSFSISSLGGIGGTGFTPIVNVPDVAILGISKAMIKPVYLEGEFKPRLLLPLALSYDHRVVDGAQGARFITFLSQQLSDIRRLLL